MRPHCAFCCAHPGLIVVGREHTSSHIEHRSGRPADCPGCYEQFGPCPFCEKGKDIEFSDKGWGVEGFWKGVNPKPADIDETCRCVEQRLPRAANLGRITELKEMVAAYLVDAHAQKTDVPRPVVVTNSMKLGDAMPAELQAASRNGQQPDDDDEIGTLL